MNREELLAIENAIANILGPSRAAMRHPLAGDEGACPHGNIPFYPTHARWCDECWEALEEARETVRARIEHRPEPEVLAKGWITLRTQKPWLDETDFPIPFTFRCPVRSAGLKSRRVAIILLEPEEEGE